MDLDDSVASFKGESSSDLSGYSVAVVGDVNGDGYDDVIIGAYQVDDPENHIGEVYLIYGSNTGWAANQSLTNADASFIGENADDWAGYRVAGAGDVNGDGYSDFLIGAHRFHYQLTADVGKTYLIFGGDNVWTSHDNDLSMANASFIGEAENDYSGIAVAGVGDVNGDGFFDIMIGAPNYNNGGGDSGRTYLIFGKGDGWQSNLTLDQADVIFTGQDANDQSGYSVAGAGDMNGDGYDDMLIGAPWDETGASDAGTTYIIYGGEDIAGGSLPGAADASFVGMSPSDRTAKALAGAGDVNGDGLADILIGAKDTGMQSGVSYLIFGNASGWQHGISLSEANASFSGFDMGHLAGASVAGAGDVNGDGFDDLVIGVPAYDGPGSQSGAAHLFLGKRSGWTKWASVMEADRSFIGETSYDSVGTSVSGGGDINGDGYDDLVIGAPDCDEPVAKAGKTYIVFPYTNERPSDISDIKACSDEACQNEIHTAYTNDTVYVEISGTDVNIGKMNVATARVTSDGGPPLGFILRLYETGTNTGTFHGNFSIKNRTHKWLRFINASAGDSVTITSTEDPTKEVTIDIISEGINLRPGLDQVTVKEDDIYEEHFWTIGNAATGWSFETNASSWLNWDLAKKNISGTPDNGDVGVYWVKIHVIDGLGGSDEINFTIEVNNTEPNITTQDIYDIDQDMLYEVDYNSDDDGSGIVTWHLDTNATWLDINTSAGLLNGTPTGQDTGWYLVNVSVDDGNDGWDWSEFRLNVSDLNDPPVIITSDDTSANEDEQYSVTYVASDNDTSDLITWYFSTNATTWLNFDNSTGILNGTPLNGDVGSYWVNLTVMDNHGAMDIHNFTLTVVNVNDPPKITSTPSDKRISVLQRYSYHVNATDVDVGDQLSYGLDESPNGMTIDLTGLVEWTPTLDQAGQHRVVINVSDGEAFDIQEFDIDVSGNQVPRIISDPVTTASVGRAYTYQVEATDGDDDPLTYSLDEGPLGMTINSTSGLVDWIPSVADAGLNFTVTVNVTDGTDFDIQSFVIQVPPIGSNDAPEITSQSPTNKVKVGKEYTYRVVVSDNDVGDLLIYDLIDPPEGMEINRYTGLIVWVPTDSDIGSHVIKVHVTDGKGGYDEQIFNLEVVKETGPTTTGIQDQFPYLLLFILIVVVVIVLAAVALKRKKPAAIVEEGPVTVIDDIFLIYKDGRLISHHTRKLKPDMDDDLLGGMFTAVQEFVKTSLGTDEGKTINEITIGDQKVLLEHGRHIYIAAVVAGEGTKDLHENIKTVVNNLEVELGPVLGEWDGDVKALKAAKRWIKLLISGEKVERMKPPGGVV